MAFNEFMHERNIYRVRPNFKDLAEKYPDFKAYVTYDDNGKASVDFKNPAALRSLTITCLKNDFQLDVNIPENRLVPTLPSRLNYILWIEDLLNLNKSCHNKEIIDIGTGACCIYPLLGASKNGWSFLATEIDQLSIDSAQANVNRNSLQDKITINKRLVDDSLFPEYIGSDDKIYDFTMSNPPFYESKLELQCSEERAAPSSVNTGSNHETICYGGEVEFVSKLIEESVQIKDKVRIFSSLLGKKSSLKSLKNQLTDAKVASQTCTEFYQGNTMRWALAWTFNSSIPLQQIKAKVKLPKKNKAKPPLTFELPCDEDKPIKMSDLLPKTQALIDDLKMCSKILKKTNSLVVLKILAKTNTWSHQRRKRRQEKRQQPTDDDDVVEPKDVGSKRKLDDQTEPLAKVAKLAEVNFEVEQCVLACTLLLKVRSFGGAAVELQWIQGSLGREAMHQVLQYFKNHLVSV